MTYSIHVPQTIDLTLDRILHVLSRLGNPQHRLPPVVHVAGTNGKGSTIAFLQAILEGQGYKVHTYTSPHLIRVNERIKIAGKDISDIKLPGYIERVKAAASSIELSYFEELTAAAFLAFSEHTADFCLLEVGLGGRLDATNVITPAVCVITPISLDHQEYLGDTLRNIAQEKTGIIKHRIPVVCATQRNSDVMKIITEKAKALSCDLILPGSLAVDIPLGLLGAHQYENAAAAVAAAKVLLPKIPEERVLSFLKNAVWPGRLQKIFDAYDIWVDGAHNQDGIAALSIEIQKWKREGKHLVFAMNQLSNRSAGVLIPVLALADDVYHIDMQQGSRFRGLFEGAKKSIPVNEALSYFMQPEYNKSRILFTGSLYLVGEILKMREIINGDLK